MCELGTGSVVMYMVMMRYRYSIPIRKKNLRPMIDLKTHTHTLYHLQSVISGQTLTIWQKHKHDSSLNGA